MADRDSLTSSPDQLVDRASDDWPSKAAATIVQYVGTVRDKTTGPALSASRVAVYALAMGLIGLVLALLALILVVRVLVVATGYVPGVESGETWLAYYILGALFLLPGLFLWRKKEK